MIKKCIAFRIDGGPEIGLGHVMRCLAIAEDLKRNKVPSVFILRYHSPQVRGLIKSAGFAVELLRSGNEAERTIAIAGKYHAKVVVADISHRKIMPDPRAAAQYFGKLRAAGLFLIVFDGLTNDCLSLKVALPVQRVVIPYFGATKQKYRRFIGTRFLLGPSYFIFRKEFVAQKRNKVSRPAATRRILITMGGADPDGATLTAIKSLGQTSYELKVVLGNNFSAKLKSDLKAAAKKYPGRLSLINGTKKMASLMNWSDAVICSGLTKYEALFLGKSVAIVTKGQSRPFKMQGKSTGQLDDQGIQRILKTIPQGVWS